MMLSVIQDYAQSNDKMTDGKLGKILCLTGTIPTFVWRDWENQSSTWPSRYLNQVLPTHKITAPLPAQRLWQLRHMNLKH